MAATTINLPLYQVLTELKVPEDRARQAAEASVPDLANLATRDDLRVAFDTMKASMDGLEQRIDKTIAEKTDSLEQRIGRTIAEKADGQTKWIAGIAATTIIVLLSASAWLWPPTRFPRADDSAIRAALIQSHG